jgi:radical SAM superfamily enzyme YgiQ (UPF0313 family)
LTTATQRFQVEIIKPSHYDDDGYVIQWRRAYIPSNSLAAVVALAVEVGERRALGEDVEIDVHAYDEVHTVIPTRDIIKRFREGRGPGFVMLAGVQTNQFPRAVDLAREFLDAGMRVAIGGFHVSGCLAMLPELPAEIKAAQELGITLFAGEAEGRMEGLLHDAYHDELKPLYDYMQDLPDLRGQVPPFLPRSMTQRYLSLSTFDAGRGCPFACSFCTIINVQGRKSRFRDPDDVEAIVRANLVNGIGRFFITDDNFARNQNWEPIFDRLIEMREKEGLKFKLLIQVDTLCHKIPGFVEKAKAAGTNRVFIGLENINPENLVGAGKGHNRITEYRSMLQAWHRAGVLTFAGYILGFPADTPESIERDIAIIQRELPIDILEFFILTPLPGSEDHQGFSRDGVWMDPDMNKYDAEHAVIEHPAMGIDVMEEVYHRAWHLYYSPEHIETLIRRAYVRTGGTGRMVAAILQFWGNYKAHKIHPLQGGLWRRQLRRNRRWGMPLENPLVFYPRRWWRTVSSTLRLGWMALKLVRLGRRVKKDPQRREYTDLALAPVTDAVNESLELFEQTEAARAAVARAQRQARQRKTPTAP